MNTPKEIGVYFVYSAKLWGYPCIRCSTLCACILGATLSAFGSQNAGADPGRWRVEFLGDKAFQASPYASGDNWEFRATLMETGATKVFKSGTERGWFINVHAYGRYALVDTDVGSGARGFTLYDLEADRKVVEFYTAFPHVSPDGPYLVYRKFMSRAHSFRPQVKIIDLNGDLGGLDVDERTTAFEVLARRFFRRHRCKVDPNSQERTAAPSRTMISKPHGI